MTRALARWLQIIWYQDSTVATLLLPLAWLFAGVVKIRRFLYQNNIIKSQRLSVPVIVVGNITVGGTGKTPLVSFLTQLLKANGYKPGIISRGYGGKTTELPLVVTPNSAANLVGDEPLLLAQQTQLPVVIGTDRVLSAQKLLAEFDCDVIISDDGLQHYKLQRDIEIAVIDGERRVGNAFPLPAGPLREPVARLNTVDFIIVNGKKTSEHEFTMQLIGNIAINLLTGEQKPLSAFAKTDCHAVAGIGNPARFFKMLAAAGLTCTNHEFPDHYLYQAQDIQFNNTNPVLMTEKDAVKCLQFASKQHWYVPVKAELEPAFKQQFLDLLQNIKA